MEFNRYLSYEEYLKLGGKLEEESAFNLLEYEARKTLDLRTQRRLVGLEEQPVEVKMCVFHLINKIQSIYEVENKSGNIASETVGGWTRSYVTGSQIQEIIKSSKKELEDIILSDLYGLVVDGVAVTFIGVL